MLFILPFIQIVMYASTSQLPHVFFVPVSGAPEPAPIEPPRCRPPPPVLCGNPTTPYGLACPFWASRPRLAVFAPAACRLMPAARSISRSIYNLVHPPSKDDAPWSEVIELFSDQFPGRSSGSIQVFWSTALKNRAH
jgi:hypothetical protein